MISLSRHLLGKVEDGSTRNKGRTILCQCKEQRRSREWSSESDVSRVVLSFPVVQDGLRGLGLSSEEGDMRGWKLAPVPAILT